MGEFVDKVCFSRMKDILHEILPSSPSKDPVLTSIHMRTNERNQKKDCEDDEDCPRRTLSISSGSSSDIDDTVWPFGEGDNKMEEEKSLYWDSNEGEKLIFSDEAIQSVLDYEMQRFQEDLIEICRTTSEWSVFTPESTQELTTTDKENKVESIPNLMPIKMSMSPAPLSPESDNNQDQQMDYKKRERRGKRKKDKNEEEHPVQPKMKKDETESGQSADKPYTILLAIFEIFQESKYGRMTLQELYPLIRKKHPHLTLTKSWMNSVRHALDQGPFMSLKGCPGVPQHSWKIDEEDIGYEKTKRNYDKKVAARKI